MARNFSNDVDKVLIIILNLNPELHREFFKNMELPDNVEEATYRTFPRFLKAVQEAKELPTGVILFLPEKRFNPSKLRQICLLVVNAPVHIITDNCNERTYLTYLSAGIRNIITPPFNENDCQSVLDESVQEPFYFQRSKELIKEGQIRLDFLIPSNLSRVVGVNRLVSFLTAEFGFPPEDYRVNLPMVMDEALSNAIIHGNRNREDLKVHIRIYISVNRVIIQIEDQGKGFDCEKIRNPTGDGMIYKDSGRGVYIINEIMDRVTFRNNGQVIEMEKSNKRSKI
jgi:serine/threonine-protein kinase RsbW